MRKKTILGLAGTALFIVCVGWCSLRVVRNWSYYGSLSDVFFNVLFLFEDQTQWAPGYSESVFKTVTKGMSAATVRELLGEPLAKEVYSDGSRREYWRYTKGSPDSSYWFRTITINQDSVVEDIGRKYFVD